MSTWEQKKILEDIEERGVPLEIDVSECFAEEPWSLIPQYGYVDGKTGKMRTVDFLAHYLYDPFKYPECPTMVVECRKSSNPWVFFPSPDYLSQGRPMQARSKSRRLDMLTLSTNRMQLLSFLTFLQPSIDGEKIEDLVNDTDIAQLAMRMHSFDTSIPRSHLCHVAFKKTENTPDSFQRSKHQILGTILDFVARKEHVPIVATIVLRGKMYEYKRQGNFAKLEIAKHILFSTLETLSQIGGEIELSTQSYVPPAIIDIVSDDYFRYYLKLLHYDFDVLANLKASGLLRRYKP